MRWVTQCWRLAKPLSSISAKFMRHYYISVPVLRMLYMADLFLIPASGISKGTKGFVAKLWQVQRQASLHITGAMKTVSHGHDRHIHRSIAIPFVN